MTDTMDQTNQTDATEANGDSDSKPKRKMAVQYTLEVVDELPEKGSVTSPFDTSLDQIIEKWNSDERDVLLDGDGNAKWVLIGRYDNSTAAGAAANVLGQRHGKSPNVEGWDFAARRIDGGEKTGLFVRYDPNRIVPGAKEAWEKSETERKAKLAAAREAKKAKEAAEAAANAQTNTDPSGQDSPAPVPVPQPSA